MPTPAPNHYATLGLHTRCTPQQIRDAYRILAKKFHPDLNDSSAEAVSQTQELNAAYAILVDPEKRRAYDESLAHAAKAKSGPRTTTQPKLKQNITRDVALKLEDFFRGTSLEVQVNDPGNPGGPESYTLEVPGGTPPGTRFRIRREGPNTDGHVIVRVTARPDFRYKVRGSDLRCDLRISAKRAAQGGTESVRGVLGGFLRVSIAANIARGTVVKLEGEGLPKARGGRGDLLVRVLYTPDVRIVRSRR